MNFNYLDVFIAISAKDIQLLTDFYSQFLQKQPDVFRPGIYTEFKLEKLRIGIFSPKLNNQKEFENINSSMSLCVEVDNLNAAIATLTDMGFPPQGQVIEASHGTELYAYDPEGNRLILHQPTQTSS